MFDIEFAKIVVDEYIEISQARVTRHNEALAFKQLLDCQDAEKEKLICYLETRKELFKLLILLWKQVKKLMNKEKPSEPLIQKMLDRYDERACGFLEYINDLSANNYFEEERYLYDCKLIKQERDLIKDVLEKIKLI